MHSYAINSQERKIVPFYIAGISILIVFALKSKIAMPNWIPIPSVFAIYGGFYALFNKYIWKWDWLNSIGVVKTPNLNGEWEMLSRSSFTNYEIEYTGRLIIQQTWTEISLFFEGEKANSFSVMASINFLNHSLYTIDWQYLSKKKPQFSDDEYMHYGLTRLLLDNGNTEGTVLRGDYFTDRSRNMYGEMTIKKA